MYRKPYYLKKTKGKAYCSQDCFGKSCRKETLCNCGASIFGQKKTCSRSCANQARTGIKYTGRQPKSKAKRGKAIKQRLLLSRGLRCEICKYDNINILVGHHLIEKAKGGSDDLDNLQLLCPNCHYTIHLGDSRITDC